MKWVFVMFLVGLAVNSDIVMYVFDTEVLLCDLINLDETYPVTSWGQTAFIGTCSSQDLY